MNQIIDMNENQIIKSIAIYRFIAICIVLYYHLLIIPTYSLEVINVIDGTLEQTILGENRFASFGLKIFEMFHMDMGSLAVVMFFIASGFLSSKMMDRYSRREYLINRGVSTFPTLWVCCIVCAIIVYFSQHISFMFSDFLGSFFPFWPKSSGTFISAVLWTLRIEMKYYLLAAAFGKNRKQLICGVYALIFLVSLLYYEFRYPWLYYQMLDLQFMCFILLGVAIDLISRKEKDVAYIHVAIMLIVNILLFKISVWIFDDAGNRMTYYNCFTQIIPTFLLLGLMVFEKRFPLLYKYVPKFIYSIGKRALPLYLTHVSCGITIMYQMHRLGLNDSIVFTVGIILSFIISEIVYVCVTKPSYSMMKKIIKKLRNKREIVAN